MGCSESERVFNLHTLHNVCHLLPVPIISLPARLFVATGPALPEYTGLPLANGIIPSV